MQAVQHKLIRYNACGVLNDKIMNATFPVVWQWDCQTQNFNFRREIVAAEVQGTVTHIERDGTSKYAAILWDGSVVDLPNRKVYKDLVAGVARYKRRVAAMNGAFIGDIVH